MKARFLLLFPCALLSLPQGADVQGNIAQISTGGQEMQIVLCQDKTVINWDSFSIAHQELVRIEMPSVQSSMLNRVVGGNISEIYGRLQANGQVWLINPAGILIGREAVIETGGFLASTFDVMDRNFLDGIMKFEGEGATIQHLGTIAAPYGDVHLIGKSISIEGSIDAKKIETAYFYKSGNSLIAFDPDVKRDHPYAHAIQMSGILKGEEIHLFADEIDVSGTIVSPGGEILIGGDCRGSNESAPNAMKTIVREGSYLDVSGKEDAGRVILWSDGFTHFGGEIQARGGETKGNGGFVEVSGHVLDFCGKADRSASSGMPGTLLLDPFDLTISTASDNAVTASSPFTPTGTGSVLNTTTLINALGSGPVVVDTTGVSGSENGAITLAASSPISTANTGNLTFTATGPITIGSPISIVGDINFSTTGTGTVTSYAGITVSSAITTSAGSITLVGVGRGSGTGRHGVDLAAAMSTGGSGSISVTGTSSATSTGTSHGINITVGIASGGGTVTLNGTVPSGATGTSFGISAGSNPVTTTGSGLISLTGTSSSTGAGSHGINGSGSWTTGGTANLSLTGTTTGGANSGGVNFSSSPLTVTGGNLTITGTFRISALLAITANAFSASSTMTLGANSLSLTANSMTFGGNISGTSTLTLTARTSTTSIGVAGGSGTLSFPTATLDLLQAGFSGITFGGSLITGGLNIGSYTFKDSVTFTQTNSGTGGTITVGGALATLATKNISFSAQNISITSGNSVIAGGSGSISMNAFTAINAAAGSSIGNSSSTGSISMSTSASPTFTLNGSVNTTGAITISPGSGNLVTGAASTIGMATTTGNIAITLTTIALATNPNSIQSTGMITFTIPSGSTIGIGTGSSGTLNFTNDELDTLKAGFSSVRFVGNGGNVDIRSYTFKDSVNINGGISGTMTVNGTLSAASGKSITLQQPTIAIGASGWILPVGNADFTILVSTFNIANGGKIGNSSWSGNASLQVSSIGFSNAANSIQGTGNFTLYPNGSQTVGIGTGAAASTLQISAAALNSFSPGFTLISIGRVASSSGNVDLRSYTFSSPFAISFGGGTLTVNGTVATTAGNSITLQQPTINLASGSIAPGTGGDATITTNALAITAGVTIQGTGALLIQPSTTSSSIGIGGTTPTGTLNLIATELDAIQAGFSSITIGSATGSGPIDVQSYTFKDSVTIQAPSGGTMTVNGTLSTLTGKNITLRQPTIATAASGQIIAGTGGSITLSANAFTLGGAANSIQGTSTLLIQPIAAATTMGIGGVSPTGTLNLTATEIGTIQAGFSSITIGSATGTGNIEVQTVTFQDDILIRSPNGGVMNVSGVLTSATGKNIALLQPTIGTAVTTGGIVAGTGGSITLSTNSINLNSPANSIQGTGSLLIQPIATATTIGIGGTSPTGTLNLTATEIGTFQAGFSSVTIGSSTGTGNIEVQSVTFSDDVLIQAPNGGTMSILGTLATSATKSITLTQPTISVGATGKIIPGTSGMLTVNASTSFATLAGSEIGNGSSTGNYVFNINGLSLAGAANTIQSTGALTIAPLSPSTTIGVGTGATGTIQLSETGAASLKAGFSSVTIGSPTGSGDIQLGIATFQVPVIIQAPNGGTMTILGAFATSGSNTITLNQPIISLSSTGSLVSGTTGALMITAATSLSSASGATIGNGSSMGSYTFTTDSLGLMGANSVQSQGSLLIQPFTPSLTIGVANTSGILNLPSSVLDVLKSGFSQITIGSPTSSGTITASAYSFQDSLTLQSPSGGAIIVDGALSIGESNDFLTLDAPSITLDSAGTTLQTQGGQITLTGPTLLLASTGIVTNGGNLTFSGAITGLNQLLSLTTSAGVIHISGSIGTSMDPLSTLTINDSGGITVTGDIYASSVDQTVSATGASSLNGITATMGGITLAGTSFTFNGPISTTTGDFDLTNTALATFSSAATLTLGQAFIQSGGGGVELGASIVTTNGGVSFSGAVQITEDLSITTGGGGNISFASTLEGSQNLNLAAGLGTVSITGAVINLNTFQISSGSSASFGSSISAQEIDVVPSAIFFGSTSTVTSSVGSIQFHSALNGMMSGMNSVTLSPATTVSIDGAIGNTVPLNAFSISSGTSASLGGSINSASITVQPNTQFSASATVTTTGAIQFAGTINSLFPLVLDAGGAITLSGAVGNSLSLPSFTINESSSATLNAITTTGNISLTIDDLTLNGALTTSSGGALLIEPSTSSVNMGIGTGALGTFLLSNTELGLIQPGFSSLTFGSAMGTGTIDVRSFAFDDPVIIRSSGIGGVVQINGALVTNTNGDFITLEGDAIQLGASVTTLNGDITLTGPVTLIAAGNIDSTGGDILFSSTIGGMNALTLAAATGSVTLQGAASGLSSLDVTGGIVTLDAVTTVGNLSLTTNDLTLNGTLTTTGAGALVIEPLTLSTNIGIGTGASGTFVLNDTELGQIQPGFSSITFGSSSGTGTIDVQSYTFDDPIVIRSSGIGGVVEINGVLATSGSGDSITLQANSIDLGAALMTMNGDITLTGPVTLSAVGTITSSGGDILFSSTITGMNPLTLNAATGSITLQGAASGISSLDATGAAIVLNGVSTVGNLSLTTDDLTFNGPLTSTGAGTFLIEPLTPSTSIGIGTGATGTLSLSNAELAQIQSGFSSLTFGSATGTGTIDVRSFTFSDPILIRSPGAGGVVQINGALATNTNGDSISLQAATIQLGASLTTVTGNITLTGPVTLTAAGNIDSSGGDILFSSTIGGMNPLTLEAGAGAVTVQGAVSGISSLTSSSGSFSSLAIGTNGNVSITTNTISLGGNISGTGVLVIEPLTNSTSIGLGNSATGTLNLNSAEIAFIQSGFTSITIGSMTGSGAVDLRASSYPAPLLIQSPGGAINTSGTIQTTGASDLELSAASIDFGSATLLTTANGNITLSGPVHLSSASSVTTGMGGDIFFSAAVTGTQNITLNAGAGTIGFGAGVGTSGTPLGTLTLQNSAGVAVAGNLFASTIDQTIAATGPSTYNGTITTTGSITFRGTTFSFQGATQSGGPYHLLNSGNATFAANVSTIAQPLTIEGPVLLDGSILFATGSGAAITFSNTIDGTTSGMDDLLINAGSGTVLLAGNIGVNTPLKIVSVTGASITLPAQIVTIGNTQTYTGPTFLVANTTLTDTGTGGITFTSTIDGALYTLSLNANGGPVSVQDAIDVLSLDVHATQAASFLGSMQTTNDVTITSDEANVHVSSILSSAGSISLHPSGLTTLNGGGDYSPHGILELYGDLQAAGTVTLEAIPARTVLANIATIAGELNRDLTITAAELAIGDYETLTVFGDVTFAITGPARFTDIVALGTISSTASFNTIFTRGPGLIYDSFGVLYNDLDTNILSNAAEPSISPYSFTGAPGTVRQFDFTSSQLLYGSLVLTLDAESLPPPPPPGPPPSPSGGSARSAVIYNAQISLIELFYRLPLCSSFALWGTPFGYCYCPLVPIHPLPFKESSTSPFFLEETPTVSQ